jgi:uncharacterized protein (TIGR02996 family)
MPLMGHPEEDRFIRGIAGDPEDEALRLVYADWLEEHGHEARSAYLRAEAKHFKSKPKKRNRWSKAEGVDPVWANMVSRPPFGILVPGLTFSKAKAKASLESIRGIERHLEMSLPSDYAAFLLLHNGGVPSREFLWWPWDESDQYDAVRFFSAQERPPRRRKPYWQMGWTDPPGAYPDEEVGPLMPIGTITYQKDPYEEGQHYLAICFNLDATTRVLDFVFSDGHLTRATSDLHDHDTFLELLCKLTEKE